MSAHHTALGTYLDVNADAFIAGRDPRGLVMAFFQHADRIEIADIRVSRECELGEGMDWQDCAYEAEDSIHRGRIAEPMGASEYHFRRAMDFIELAIARREALL